MTNRMPEIDAALARNPFSVAASLSHEVYKKRQMLREEVWIGCFVASYILRSASDVEIERFLKSFSVAIPRANTRFRYLNGLIRAINHHEQDMRDKNVLNRCTFEAKAAHVLVRRNISTCNEAVEFLRREGGVQAVCAAYDDNGVKIDAERLDRRGLEDVPIPLLNLDDIYNIRRTLSNDDWLKSIEHLSTFKLSDDESPLPERDGLSIIAAAHIGAGNYKVIGHLGELEPVEWEDLKAKIAVAAGANCSLGKLLED